MPSIMLSYNFYFLQSVEILLDQEDITTIEIADLQPASAPVHVVDLTEDAPSTSVAPADPTPKMKRTCSYIRKRSRNNEACRESRKKRKVQRVEASEKVDQLTADNDRLRRQISQLEVEVRETRATLLAKMTGKKVEK